MSSAGRLARPVQPLAATQSLRERLIAHLSDEIVGGRLTAGEKLPTEQEMAASFGVSRTVVREAVAALRSEGLVITRQGQGAFVNADRQNRPFRIDSERLESVQDLLHVVELRLAVEVEAAGLAAERARPPQITAIRQRLTEFRHAMALDQSAVGEDFAFHRAIAEASGNPRFAQFLEYLGHLIIPRWTLRESERREERSAYLAILLEEHEALLGAIAKRNVAGAREAARLHLTNGRERMRRELSSLLRSSKEEGA